VDWPMQPEVLSLAAGKDLSCLKIGVGHRIVNQEYENWSLGICGFPLSRGKETGRGLERVIEEFCRFLTRRNVSFDFYERGLIHSEVKAVLQSLSYLRALRRMKKDCYFAVYAVSGIFPALLQKKPLVTLITDLIPFHVAGYDNSLKYAIKRWCAKFSSVRSDRLIVGSSSIRNELVERFGVDVRKIVVVPWGVDHKTYYPAANVVRVRNRVAFLGEAKRAKGIDAVIRSFRFVVQEVADATLVIGGSGRDLEEMKQLAAETLPTNSFLFAGFIPEAKMNEFYNSADVFIFPSRYGFGLSALEAMACGTPTLVGATLDAKDFFFDEDLMVDPDADEQIAEKLISLLRNNEKKTKKGHEAIEFARQFSWESMSQQYLDVCLRGSEMNPT
jgi:glycosyltransferase involved in cell wall biosynthesis